MLLTVTTVRSTDESYMQGRYDTSDSERKASQSHRDNRRELGCGVYVILNHDLQAQRRVMEQSDQKQDHQDGGER